MDQPKKLSGTQANSLRVGLPPASPVYIFGTASNNAATPSTQPEDIKSYTDTLYYPLNNNPAGYLTVETDPTVPAYSKSLTGFSIIKSSTDTLYYPLSSNPANYLTSFTESDPTVPGYAKSLTSFSVIKSSTDTLYQPIGSYLTTISGISAGGDLSGTYPNPTVSKFNGQLPSYYLNYNNLTNTPVIPAAQIQSDWNQTSTSGLDYIKNKPVLSLVATSGNYNDLSNKPTALSSFTNDSGYLTTITADARYPLLSGSYVNPSWITSLPYSKITGTPVLAAVATSGSYNDLSNKPVIYNFTGSATQYTKGDGTYATFPTSLSSFSNDPGYLTNTTGDARYVLLSGSYNNPSWITALSWTKIISTPTTIAGYGITDAYTKTQVNSLPVSTFTNDAGYITSTALPVGANPTTNIGLSVINGTASTFMRSDAAPAIDQSIVPTWTGQHTFSANINSRTILPVTTNTYNIGSTSLKYATIYTGTINSDIYQPSATSIKFNNSSGTTIGQWFSTGNLVVQTSGTFTDNGYKLDVIGSTRVATLTRSGAGSGTVTTGQGVFATFIGNSYNDTSTAASGTVGTVTGHSFYGPTLTAANTGVIYTNLSTVFIAGPPVASTNITASSLYSLYIGSGSTLFNGLLNTQTITPITDIAYNLGSAGLRYSNSYVGQTYTAHIRPLSSSFTIDNTAGSTSMITFFTNSGNTVFQTGGTFTDANYKVDIQSSGTVGYFRAGLLTIDTTGTAFTTTATIGTNTTQIATTAFVQNTVLSTDALIWTEITATTKALVAGQGSIATSTGSTQLVFSMPTASVVGQPFGVMAKGSGGFKINLGTGDKLLFGTTTVSTSITCAAGQMASLKFICITANTGSGGTYELVHSVGTLTYV